MIGRVSVSALLLVAGLLACGRDPTSTPAPTSPYQQITGTEQLAWNETASEDELPTLSFFALIDDTRSELAGVACQATASAGAYSCASRLPPMSPGPHSIQVVAFNGVNDSVPSWPPLLVNVVPVPVARAGREGVRPAHHG